MSIKRYELGRLAAAYYSETNLLVDFSAATAVPPGDTTAARAKWLAWLDDAGTKETGNLMDVTIGLADDTADATTRYTASFGFASTVPVLHGSEVTFDMRWEPYTGLDTAGSPWDFAAVLMKNWQDGTPMSMVFLDQDRTANASGGSNKYPTGLAGNFGVSLDISQALRDIQRASVTMTVIDDAVWYNEEIVASP